MQEGIYQHIMVTKLKNVNILNTFKVGTTYIRSYSRCNDGDFKYYKLSDLLKNFHNIINSNKVFILIRNPYRRLLGGIFSSINGNGYSRELTETGPLVTYKFQTINGLEQEVRVPDHDEWLNKHGYKFYLYMLNKYWFKIRDNEHLTHWLINVEEIVDRYPQVKVVDLKDLTNLLNNLQLNIPTIDSVNTIHSNKRHYKYIAQALEHEDLKPFIKTRLNSMLRMESESYDRLSSKVEKIVPNFF